MFRFTTVIWFCVRDEDDGHNAMGVSRYSSRSRVAVACLPLLTLLVFHTLAAASRLTATMALEVSEIVSVLNDDGTRKSGEQIREVRHSCHSACVARAPYAQTSPIKLTKQREVACRAFHSTKGPIGQCVHESVDIAVGPLSSRQRRRRTLL